MPCGGIYPLEGSAFEHIGLGPCWHCNKSSPAPDHWCEEWDTAIHRGCIDAFLRTDEGRCVITHKHLIQVGDEIWQCEGGDADPNSPIHEIIENWAASDAMAEEQGPINHLGKPLDSSEAGIDN